MAKVLVLSVPRLEPHRPPLGTSVLATTCQNAGHNVELVDLNIKFFNKCKDAGLNYYNFDDVWDGYRDATTNELKFLKKFISDFIIAHDLQNFDYIMLSVFGVSNHYFSRQLLKSIHKNRNFKILIGGSGAFISTCKSKKTFVDFCKQKNYIDDFIRGECEESVVKYLNNETGDGINNHNFKQINNLDALPTVSYDFVNLDEYDYLGDKRSVYIEGSRGCVRSCTYCDVVAYWPKYRYRSGNHIASEIIKNYEKHGITDFYFTDSLVNGSLKAFSEMCQTLSNYNFHEQISWGGQFIFRSKKSVPPEHFEMISKAGGNIFYVGIETGSDRIRNEMGKNFSNEDIEYQLEQFKINNLKTTFLMFPGYVTETYDDHLETVAMFSKWQKYVASGTINGLELGAPLLFLENSPLARMLDSHKIEFLDTNSNSNKFWISKNNPNFDYVTRIERQLELYREAIKYNWPIWRTTSRLNSLKNSLLLFYESIQNGKTYKKLPVLN